MTFQKWWKTLNSHEKSAMIVLLSSAGIANLISIGYVLGQWFYS
ncbi:hypothetical protein [Cognaticolwellia mytili]|nr:hypothetical protein [Cognaticolwellia mytili]